MLTLSPASADLGVLYRSDIFVAVDNTVTLPGYVQADGAVYFALSKQVRLQANVENLFGKTYYINADSNTNISPGFRARCVSVSPRRCKRPNSLLLRDPLAAR